MRRPNPLGLNFALEDRLAPANAGDIDPTFGLNGVATPLFGIGAGGSGFFGSTSSVARGVAVQPDGRIVLVGSAPSNTAGSGFDFAVTRLLPNGTTDPTFGTGGLVRVGFDLGGSSFNANDDDAYAVALQSDGKIVVAGTIQTTGNGSDFGIVRLNTDGTLDTTFGGTGKVDLPFNTGGTSSFNDDGATSVAIQTDGMIVVAGFSRFDFAAARLKTTGALDTTFGTKGQATVPFGGSAFSSNKANAVALQSDGKIILAGSVENSSFQNDFGVTRLNTNGSVDATFANKGKLTVPFDVGGFKNDDALAAAVQADGKIVVVGAVESGFYQLNGNRMDMGLIRLNTDGSFDQGFGPTGNGKETIGFDQGGYGADQANAVVVQPDGKIVVAGSADATFFQANPVAARLNTDGTLDTTFGKSGKTTVRLFSSGFSNTIVGANAVTLDAAGNVILAGTDGSNFIAARLFGVAPPPPPTPPEPPPDTTPPKPQPVPLSALPRQPSPILVGGRADGTGQVMLNRGEGAFFPGTMATFFPGEPTDVRTAVGDVNGDLVPDYIGGAGPGFPNQVVVIDGKTGDRIADFSPFEDGYTGGVYVASADMDGDGKADVVVSADQGGGPVVVVYNGDRLTTGVKPAFSEFDRFLGIADKNFRGGARVAVGDVNHDGTPDLVVAAGFGGGPRVAVFNGKDVVNSAQNPSRLMPDFFAFEPTVRNGAFVAAGDVDGDGFADLAFGGGPGGAPRVRVVSGQQITNIGPFSNLDQLTGTAQLQNFFAGDPNSRGGVTVALRDVDGDGKADLSVGSGVKEASHMRVYSGTSLLQPTVKASQDLTTFDGSATPNGTFVG